MDANTMTKMNPFEKKLVEKYQGIKVHKVLGEVWDVACQQKKNYYTS